MTKKKSSVFLFAARFSSGTFLSRLSGLFRDIAMAYFFGTSPQIALFFVAYRFSNLMRRLFGESPLSGSFIPHFEKARSDGEDKGGSFFIEFFYSLGIILLLLVALLEVVLAFAKAFVSPDTAEMLALTMVMLPGLLFICFCGLVNSLLHCEGSYFLPSVAPVVFNVVWIAGAFIASFQAQPLYILSISIVIGFFCQWLFLLPRALKSLKKWISLKKIHAFRPFSSRVIMALPPFCLGILGIASSQINSAVDAIFAKMASLEGPAYLWYAVRLYQLPIAFFGVSMAAALLPTFSKTLKKNAFQDFLELFKLSYLRAFLLGLPTAFLLIFLGKLSIDCLFGYGDFIEGSISETAKCLWGYSLGLVPSILTLILIAAFQAKEEFWIPMISSIISVCLNIALNAFFVLHLHLGAMSIALATSLSSFAQFFILGYLFAQKFSKSWMRDLYDPMAKIGIASLGALGLMGVGNFFISQQALIYIESPALIKFFELFSGGALFLTGFLILGYFLKIPDIRILLRRSNAKKPTKSRF